LPFLGVLMSDLTFIEEGNPDFLKDNTIINFEKRALVAKVMMEMQQHQQSKYMLKPVPAIQNYLNSLHYNTENELYDKSLQREPRDSV
jgi:son of sevenless-like protein